MKISPLEDNDRVELLDMDLKIFAYIDTSLFKDSTFDTASTLERIKAVNDYKSLDEIIQSQKEVK